MFYIGNFTVHLEAKDFYVRKEKVLIFDSPLFRELVARDLKVLILENNRKVLVAYKEKEKLRPNLRSLVISRPVILYPKKVPAPLKLILDRSNSNIWLVYKNEKVSLAQIM
ncbi:hypothetical protein [Thermosulfurimonas dismutans]|uniref:Uncharacterized protein n=1 Tax=Thermosulfurimonas dismutans TaxID=999894 RepID=A0A179D644_9BACT|nr:hypothetical protein [Thermosulfurimonas dismutans]OAQ20912.1 hypothetical protein TDIS_1039 [Thermosulfurimonas dismutans]